MRIIKKLSYLLSSAIFFSFISLIILKPDICRDGAINGILICGRIIIPSLFPFTVCVVFLLKSGVLSKLTFASPVFRFLFGISAEQFAVVLLSFIGGYPIGAKLIDQCVSQKNVSKKNAGIMLNYCVNAGPAFIIGAVGVGFLSNKSIGYVLFFSHIFASIVLCFISRFFIDGNNINTKINTKSIPLTDNFTQSTAEAASTLFNISAFVILFSTINSYITYFSAKYPILKNILYISEVTNGISHTNNIYLISFILGFGGICVWCQIFSCVRNLKINYFMFILSRLFHGFLSIIFTKLLLNITKTSAPVFSAGKVQGYAMLYSTPALTISMISLIIIFLISISNKKYVSKILEDIL